MYINRDFTINLPVPIPDGYVRCPSCDGDGEIRVGWDGGHHRDFWSCFHCDGKGYVSKELVELVSIKDAQNKVDILHHCARCNHMLIDHRTPKGNNGRCHSDFSKKKCDCAGFMTYRWKKRLE
jgi:hypothetical protein